MKKTIKSSDVYLRFLQLAEAIRGLPSLPALDPLFSAAYVALGLSVLVSHPTRWK